MTPSSRESRVGERASATPPVTPARTRWRWAIASSCSPRPSSDPAWSAAGRDQDHDAAQEDVGRRGAQAEPARVGRLHEPVADLRAKRPGSTATAAITPPKTAAPPNEVRAPAWQP